MVEHSRIRLITRGDDMGAFQAGNQAIVDAFQQGILRNASIMIPATQVQHAVNLVRQVPDLCLGLHITLTSEWDAPRWCPIAGADAVPSLVDQDGCFFRQPMQLLENGVRLEEMLREVKAQLALARKLGLSIRYMDQHMGIGWLFEGSNTHRLWDDLRVLARQEGLVWERDVEAIQISYTSIEDFCHTLANLQDGDYLLVTHPAYASEEMHQVVGYSNPVVGHVARSREHDYHILCHPSVQRTIKEKGISLIRYDEYF